MERDWHLLNNEFIKKQLIPHGVVADLAIEHAEKLIQTLTTTCGISELGRLTSGAFRPVFTNTQQQLVKFSITPADQYAACSHGYKTHSKVADLILKPLTIIAIPNGDHVVSVEVYPRALSVQTALEAEVYKNRSGAFDTLKDSIDHLEKAMKARGFSVADHGFVNCVFLPLSEREASKLPKSKSYMLSGQQYVVAHEGKPLAFYVDASTLNRTTPKPKRKPSPLKELLGNPAKFFGEMMQESKPAPVNYLGYTPNIQEYHSPQLRDDFRKILFEEARITRTTQAIPHEAPEQAESQRHSPSLELQPC